MESRLVTKFEFIWSIAGGGMREDSLSKIDAGKKVRPVILGSG
jgi:hypothetical protein